MHHENNRSNIKVNLKMAIKALLYIIVGPSVPWKQ